MPMGALVMVAILAPAPLWADETKTVTPEAAAKLVNQPVVVEMRIQSATLRGDVCFLNSHANHRDPANFTVFIGRDGLAKFKEAKIPDPAVHFRGKTIRVQGKVTLFREKPQIVVTKPDDITIIEKKPPDAAQEKL